VLCRIIGYYFHVLKQSYLFPFYVQKAISLDEDLLANSERSLETLVFMGTTIGVTRGHTYEAMEHVSRPTITDSVAGQDSIVGMKGIVATDSINVRFNRLGVPEDDDGKVEEDDGNVEEDDGKVEEAERSVLNPLMH